MDALERAIAEIQQMGSRPDPVAQLIEGDARIALLRRELEAAKFTDLYDGMAGGRAVFLDFCSARYQREARIRKLIQTRRLQIAGRGHNERAEFLKHAASCRLVEKRIEEAQHEAWPHEVTRPGKLGLIAAVQSTIASAQI
jgi:hypothetical protein